MRARVRSAVLPFLVIALVGAGHHLGGALPAAAGPAVTPLYVPVNKASVVGFERPVTKVSITTPAIADVHVITPTQLLINGKSPGVTSLVVFEAHGVRHFDVIVHARPLADGQVLLGTVEPHAVIVQRADSLTDQLFARDENSEWFELGTPVPAGGGRAPVPASGRQTK